MKKLIASLLVLSCMLTLVGCSKSDEINKIAASTGQNEIVATKETTFPNEVLNYFADKYDMTFTLWGPEGHDLYAFHIYCDHAERECHILMPANTDDVSEYHKNLSWEVVDSELIITGEWQETFNIDISTETATSTSTGKVYQIYEMQPPLE